jgi:dipeptidase E
MRLLLTSAGITNQSIADALTELVGKPASDTKVALVPTASNLEKGNKDWYIRQLTNLQKYDFSWIDIVDISASEVPWRERLAEVDVVVMSGGNTFHLLDQVRKSGFAEWLKENLEKKVYVGISAGSIIITPSIAIASVDNGDENLSGLTDLTGLALVNFEVSPHTPEHVSHEGNKKYLQTTSNELYALDDQSALKVVDGTVEAVSEGNWLKY